MKQPLIPPTHVTFRGDINVPSHVTSQREDRRFEELSLTSNTCRYSAFLEAFATAVDQTARPLGFF
jgi:hypothetical protein